MWVQLTSVDASVSEKLSNVIPDLKNCMICCTYMSNVQNRQTAIMLYPGENINI